MHCAAVTVIFTVPILLRGLFAIMGGNIRKAGYVAKGVGIHQCISVMPFVSDCVRDERMGACAAAIECEHVPARTHQPGCVVPHVVRQALVT